MTKWRIATILILLVLLIVSVSAVSAANGVEELIDIKPNTFPNSINPKSGGVIPVAVLTTGTFDAAFPTSKADLSIRKTPHSNWYIQSSITEKLNYIFAL